MYLERIVVSEFANRLSNTDVKSLDGVLYLLSEYEALCELRRNEIGGLDNEENENAYAAEYEYINGEENLWCLLREMVNLVIAEINQQNDKQYYDESNYKGLNRLLRDPEFLFWSCVQSYLQKMKRKTTTITLYSEPLQDSEMSFSSLFQRSSDPTSVREAQLIGTMYSALRTGAFDDPSMGSSDDWNTLFDNYNNLWRQCSLQGAGEGTTREVFQSMCRTFRSDNPTERLLYLLHTAETPDDLEMIFSLQQQQEEQYQQLDRLCDQLWACTFCLLSQYSLRSQGKPHGELEPLLQVTRRIVSSIGNLTSLPCKLLSAILLGNDDQAVSLCKNDTNLDNQRFITHFLLLFSSIYSHVSIYVMPDHSPFTSMVGPIDITSSLLHYLHSLTTLLDIEACVCYLPILHEDKVTHVLCQLLHTILLQWTSSHESVMLLAQKIQILMKTVYCQTVPVQSSILIWIHSLTHYHSTSPNYWLSLATFIMTCLQYPSVPSPFLWNCLIDLLDSCLTQVKSEEGMTLLLSIQSAGKDRSLPSLPTEQWCHSDCYSMTEEEIRLGVQFYQTLGDGLQKLRDCSLVDEIASVVKSLFVLFEIDRNSTECVIQHVLCSLIREIDSHIVQCIQKTDQDACHWHELRIDLMKSIASCQYSLRSHVSPELSEFLVNMTHQAFVGMMDHSPARL